MRSTSMLPARRASAPVVLISSAALAGAILAACGDDSSGSSAGAGTTTTTTTTGSGGHGGGGGGAGGGGGQGGQQGTCHGDAAAWQEITAAPIACQSNADCCVVMNLCINAGQVVHASDSAQAAGAWPYCDADCNDCIPPAVQVECAGNVCVGYDVSDQEPPDSPLRVDHCGVDGQVLNLPNPAEAFGCN